jgi:short-subunit dehydrogenase
VPGGYPTAMTETASAQRPLALVTGASSGIGYELARQFAQHGYDLVVCAEDESVAGAADRLRASGGVVEPVVADLRDYDAVERLWSVVAATGRPLAAAALNAGVGKGGPFIETELPDELDIVSLNVASTVHLAKRVLDDMAARDDGAVLITSSIAATTPGPFQAVYNASKSFLQSFALALANELKDTAVSVTALMPGPTDTEFFRRADMEDTKMGRGGKDDPAMVARQGFDALMSGKAKIVAGSAKTKTQAHATSVLPDSAKAQAHRKMAEPGSAND